MEQTAGSNCRVDGLPVTYSRAAVVSEPSMVKAGVLASEEGATTTAEAL